MNKKISVLKKIYQKEFESTGLLKKKQLSRKGKIKEYRKVKEFLSGVFPELGRGNFDFQRFIMSIPYDISDKRCKRFMQEWKYFTLMYNKYLKGDNGEKMIREKLKIINSELESGNENKMLIIKNLHLKHDKHEKKVYEHDFVVISSYGIVSVEVKALSGSYFIDQRGSLLQGKRYVSNAGRQVRRHIENLRNVLKKEFDIDIPVKGLLCFTSGCNIVSSCEDIECCSVKKLRDHLLPDQPTKENKILSAKKMKEIKDFLKEKEKKSTKFDIFGDKGEIQKRNRFIKDFAYTAAVYRITHDT